MEKGFVRKVWKFPVESQRAMLKAAGLADRDIYEHGNGAEDIEACLAAFRGKGGTLRIAADFRVFGKNQEEITNVVDRCERDGIRIMDLAHPELATISKQQKWAFARLSGDMRWGGDRKRAQRTGSQGGKSKGMFAALKRAEKFPDDAIRKFVAARGRVVTYRLIEEVTDISVGTLGRHYTDKPKTRKGRK